MTKTVTLALIVSGLLNVAGLVAAGVYFSHNDRVPHPGADAISAFREHRADFLSQVEQIQRGKGRIEPDRSGHYGSPQLQAIGIRYIYRTKDCIFFLFAAGEADTVDEIVYSPKDFDSLPSFYPRDDAKNKTFCLSRIEENWFYRSWESKP